MKGVPAIGEEELRALRTRVQLLARPPRTVLSPAEIARRVCGVQAQDLPSAELALRARSDDLTASLVREARVTERAMIRTWAMRGTLHLIATEDAGWLLPLVAPRFLPRSRRRLAQLGVEGGDPARAVRLIGQMLADEGPLTRAEIAVRLARSGIRAEGQAAFHLILLTALEGLVCMGPDREGKPTFVLLRDWIGPPDAMEADRALAELARRYLSAYGPATPEDMAAWSGLGVTEARKAWRLVADEVREIDAGGRRMWTTQSQELRPKPRGVVRLLPAYDNYMLGHLNRDFAVDPRNAREVHPGGGVIRPVVLADGRAIANWRTKRRGARLTVTVEPFYPVDPRIEKKVEAEARDVGRFLNTDVELAIVRGTSDPEG